jgi:hypothetical protein
MYLILSKKKSLLGEVENLDSTAAWLGVKVKEVLAIVWLPQFEFGHIIT